jgi:hypothetical protein
VAAAIARRTDEAGLTIRPVAAILWLKVRTASGCRKRCVAALEPRAVRSASAERVPSRVLRTLARLPAESVRRTGVIAAAPGGGAGQKKSRAHRVAPRARRACRQRREPRRERSRRGSTAERTRHLAWPKMARALGTKHEARNHAATLLPSPTTILESAVARIRTQAVSARRDAIRLVVLWVVGLLAQIVSQR